MQGDKTQTWNIVNDGTIQAGNYGAGVYAIGGTVTLNNTGLLSSNKQNGVVLAESAGATITNSGTLDGEVGGIMMIGTLADATPVSITNSGSISSDTNLGVTLEMANPDTVVKIDNGSTGSIDGSAGGIYVWNGGSVTLDNKGKVTSDGGAGVALAGSGSVDITNTGTIQSDGAGYLGIYVVSPSAAADEISIANDGTIKAKGYGVYVADASVNTPVELANNGNGIIDGGAYGAIIIGGKTVTLDNAGSIGGTANAVMINATNATIPVTVTNEATGVISGTTNGSGVVISNGDVVLDNAGTIKGASHGVALMGSNGVDITNTGTIQSDGAGYVGVYVASPNAAADKISIANDGTVKAKGSGVYVADASVNTPVELANKGNGTIDGGTYGVTIYGGKMVTLDNAGSIQGGTYGVNLTSNNGATITNTGTLSTAASSTAKALVINTRAGANPVSVDNSGTVQGGLLALQVMTTDANTPVAVTNAASGTMQATTGTSTATGIGTGILFTNGAVTFTNAGTVGAAGTATNVNGVTLDGVAGGNDTIINTGTIVGSRYGIDASTSVANTDIINTGTITGENGTAIRFGSGTDTLTLDTGSVLGGNVDGTLESSSDALILKGTGTEDANFMMMENMKMSGTEWTLTGNLEFLNSSTVETGVLHLASGSLTSAEVAINSKATLDTSAGAYTITGNVTNAGIVNIGSPDLRAGNILTVSGNYTGNDGVVQLNTVLGGDSSVTDKLHVGGNVSGTSTLLIANAGGTGAQTVNGIQVVQVDGVSDSKSPDGNVGSGANFRLAQSVKAGIYEYILKSQGENWYLVSMLSDGSTSYIPEVSNYVSGQRINTETGLMQLSTLHQRVGEHRTLPLEKQSWAKVYYSHQSEDGSRRFGYDADIYGIQIGQEFLARETGDGGSVRAAVSFDYARTNADMDDRLRPQENLNRDTGSLKSDSWAIGGYVTKTYANGAYVDVVGQLGWLENRYDSITWDGTRDKAKQKGWRVGLSAEGGYPLWKREAWLLEGQGQLSYQYTDYRGFADDAVRVDGYGSDSLRGRLGVRLVHTQHMRDNRTLQVYGVANVLHDFLNPDGVPVKNKGDYLRISETYGRTWGEIGLGIQGWLTSRTSVYGDVRYQHGFSSPSGGEAREGGSLNVGLRHSF